MAAPSYLSREQLAALLRSPGAAGAVAVVDVRDEDHVGGHVRGSRHVPSQALGHRLPELVRALRDEKRVVFHCALSQQRGPAAARAYAAARQRAVEKGELGAADAAEAEGAGKVGQQEVFILDGGFTKWQEKYGMDVDLTEGYAPDIWRTPDE